MKLTRALRLGRLAYWLWYAPTGKIKKSAAEGGPLEQLRDHRAHQEMKRAASQLSPQVRLPDGAWPELHFLTGKKFWDQTALCLYTFQAHAGRSASVVFHDDGSADPEARDRLRRLFPAARWREIAEIEAQLDAVLPEKKFPTLRERRAHYPNLRKLTDVHAGARGWRLVLDSDMLFFRRPDFLCDWLNKPEQPLHMADVQDSYGYSRHLLESISGASLPRGVNVGLCGLRSDALDWGKIEFWCRRLIDAEGTSYYLEQALIAMLLAGQNSAIAPADDYILMPTEEECRAPRAVMHHYVALSKRGYFRYAWPVALARAMTAVSI